jgi:hypothetical protein
MIEGFPNIAGPISNYRSAETGVITILSGCCINMWKT